MTRRVARATLTAAVALLAAGTLVPAAHAQGPYPRSGLISRHMPPPLSLPPDEDRKFFTGTRYEESDDPPQHHPLNPLRQGLYGHRLPAKCTASYAPFFQGRPGSTFGGDRCSCCKAPHPLFRLPSSVFCPLKPVSYYYAGGSLVPIYDLDPWTIGPGTFPYPYCYDPNKGG